MSFRSFISIACSLTFGTALFAGDPDACRQECAQEAAAFLKHCIAEGLENCEARAAEKEAACIAKWCVEEPPPPPTCEEICLAHKNEVFHQCLENGAGEEACHEEANAALQHCLEKECEEPPPPPPPTCEEACAAHGEEVYNACIEDGGGPDFCGSEANKAKKACIAENCEEPPPPPKDCEEICAAHAQAKFAACLEDGGTEAHCKELKNAEYSACIERECEEPPPPPPTCEEACEAYAQAKYEACLGEGLGEGHCTELKNAKFKSCIETECEEPPPPPKDCEEICAAHAQAKFAACLEAGHGEGHCKEVKAAEYNACIERECEEPPPPPEPTCKDECRELSKKIFRECIEGGGTEKDCAAQAENVLVDCLYGCPDAPPPEPTCEERCAKSAEEAFQHCLKENPEGHCLELKNGMLAKCLDLCEGPPPPPDEDCEKRCLNKALEVLHGCLEEGLPEGECKARKETALKNCLAEECDDEPPPPEKTCEEKCEAHASEVFAVCMKKEGATEGACQEKAEKAYRECVLVKCTDEPPPDPSCEDLCEEKAAKAFHDCLEGDKGEEECKAISLETFQTCLEGCDGEPPPEPPCEDACAEQAESIFQTCLDVGGEEGTCRERADAILVLCLERCGTGQPCESRCALAAQVVLTGCELAGLPSKECRHMAGSVLERCLVGCQPELSCPDRCEKLAHKAIEECVGRGGGADKCEQEGKAMLEGCLADCEGGEPPPPCDVQCEEKAKKMLAQCLEEGIGADECEARRDEFLEECLREHGENCTKEAMADLTMFQAFMRGDVNRDGIYDITDPIIILAQLFLGGPANPCEDAVDCNDDGKLDLTDPVILLNFQFLGTDLIPEPVYRSGQDPTADSLICGY